MKRTTREWVDKAEGDATVAERELAAPNPVSDAVCFHAQQCVEKYLKGVLEERGSPRRGRTNWWPWVGWRSASFRRSSGTGPTWRC